MPTLEQRVRAFWAAFDARRWDDAKSLLAPGFVAEWPCTGERFQGSGFVDMNAAYPGRWACVPERLETTADRVVAVVRISAGGVALRCVGFYEGDETGITRALEYFADDAAPPHDRSAWSEPL